MKYDPTLEAFLDGAGTPTLSATGYAVHVDTRQLPGAPYRLWPGGPCSSSGSIQTFALLPGTYTFLGCTIGAQFPFTVEPDGTVSYASGPQGCLDGAGTSTLVVQGCPIDIDTRTVDVLTYYTRLGGPCFPAETSTLSACCPVSTRSMPAPADASPET